MSEVLTTTSIVLSAFLDELISREQNMMAVMTPQLDFKNAMRGLKSSESASEAGGRTIVVFAWNRSVVKFSETKGNRSRFQYVMPADSDHSDVYGSMLGNININFKIFTNSIIKMEEIELLYGMRKRFSDILEFSVTFEDQPEPFIYYLTWNELENLETHISGNSYLSLEGSLELSGVFSAFTSNVPVIKDIYFSAYTYDEATIVEDIHIS